MRTLIKELVTAPAVPQVVVAPRGAVRCGTIGNGVTVNQYLDGSNIPREVACIAVRLGQFRRARRDVVLRRGWRLMTEPRLQFKQCHWLASVEELAGDGRTCAMAANRSTCIFARHSCFLAEGGNQTQVQILLAQSMCPVAEQEMRHFSRLSVDHLRLFRADLFPSQNGLANEYVNRLGKGMPSFVNGDVEQAHHFRFCLCFSFWDDGLHTNTPSPQSDNFITAQSSKEPEDRQST